MSQTKTAKYLQAAGWHMMHIRRLRITNIFPPLQPFFGWLNLIPPRSDTWRGSPGIPCKNPNWLYEYLQYGSLPWTLINPKNPKVFEFSPLPRIYFFIFLRYNLQKSKKNQKNKQTKQKTPAFFVQKPSCKIRFFAKIRSAAKSGPARPDTSKHGAKRSRLRKRNGNKNAGH